MAATDREQQILAWIKQNPLISQNELAASPVQGWPRTSPT